MNYRQESATERKRENKLNFRRNLDAEEKELDIELSWRKVEETKTKQVVERVMAIERASCL
jgi:hypothetical protein